MWSEKKSFKTLQKVFVVGLGLFWSWLVAGMLNQHTSTHTDIQKPTFWANSTFTGKRWPACSVLIRFTFVFTRIWNDKKKSHPTAANLIVSIQLLHNTSENPSSRSGQRHYWYNFFPRIMDISHTVVFEYSIPKIPYSTTTRSIEMSVLYAC